MPCSEPYLTPREAAGRLRVARKFVYGLCAAGLLRHFRVGRGLRIPAGALDEYIARQSNVPPPSAVKRPTVAGGHFPFHG